MNRNRRKLARHRAAIERLEDRHYLSSLPIGNADAAQPYAQLPLAFEPNLGQAEASASFVSRGDGYTLLLAPNEASLSLAPSASGDQRGGGDQTDGGQIEMRLLGGNPNARPVALDTLSGVSNYLTGDRSQWITNVPNYARAEFANVYPGVDMIYHGNDQQRLEYDFVLAPHADPNAIQLSFEGARGVSLDAQGNLVLHTSAGDLMENSPVVYQQINGTRQAVAGRYVLEGGDRVGFSIGAHDANQPLVIDPTYSLVYSTYLGGKGGSSGHAIAVDSAGDTYVTGVAWAGFPTLHPAQAKFGGVDDVFVTKMNAAGTALVYSTYLGGTGDDTGNGIAIDAAGDAYVTGQTSSSNFPTKNAFQSSFGGGGDAFLAELNPAGSALLYSSFLGGSGTDIAHAVAVDAAGDAYVTGYAGSANFPTTAGAFQATGSTGPFAAKVNTTLSGASSLVYSTYVGGAGHAYGIAVDGSGNAYLAGQGNVPITAGAFQQPPTKLTSNIPFVSKLNAAGTDLVYSTYLGSMGGASAIAVDTAGDAYVTGEANVPTTPNAFQTAWNGSAQNVFMSELNPSGSGLTYSTYLGGQSPSYGRGIALDSQGHVYLTGYAYGSTFPTLNAFQPTPTMSVGQSTAFVAELDPSLAGAASLIYSSYLGNSSAAARGLGIAVDSGGNAYVTGYTYPGFPTTARAFETTDPAVRTKQAGQPTAAFVVKIDPPAGAKPAVSTDVLMAPAAANAPVNTAVALPHVSPAQSVDRPSSSKHQTNVETRLVAARKATDAVLSNWGEF